MTGLGAPVGPGGVEEPMSMGWVPSILLEVREAAATRRRGAPIQAQGPL
jgi:hypothetical protein